MIDSQNRLAQAYGYMVCLVAVLAGLASVAGLTNSIFDYADPIHTDRYSSGRPVTTYGAYKRAYYERRPESTRAGPGPAAGVPDSVPEATLRQMYQEDRTDRIDNTRFRALKTMASTGILLLASIILFAIHWKWLRRQSAQTA